MAKKEKENINREERIKELARQEIRNIRTQGSFNDDEKKKAQLSIERVKAQLRQLIEQVFEEMN